MTSTPTPPPPTAYYSGNPLNRLSYLRSSSAFLTSALTNPKTKFILLHQLNPLCQRPHEEDGSIKLATVGWEDVKEVICARAAGEGEGGEKNIFKFVDDKEERLLNNEAEDELLKRLSIDSPALIFLGVDERSAPESIKSLPLEKPSRESSLQSHSPFGVPYFALDVTELKELRERVAGKDHTESFVDMRAGMASIPSEEAALAGEARALIDWNKRNIFCPACGERTRSLWAGWKRTCLESSSSSLTKTPCPSKKGVNNYNYPRSDPVVIMAVLDPTRESILLGRQKIWPKKFYSCLAGFIEAGETIEEAVRREVYEEAGIEIGEVFYHSTQPWPYPSSLMIGMICVAKEGQTIRCDLDNELEDARYFTREAVLAVLNSGIRPNMTKEEVSRIDGKEGAEGRPRSRSSSDPQALLQFRMPPSTAIAHTLIEAWANGMTLATSLPNSTSSSVAGGKL